MGLSSYAHAYSAAARGEHLPVRENSRKESIVFCFLCWVRFRLTVRFAREAVLDSLPGLDFARRCSGCMPASSLSSALLGMYASFSLISLLLSGTADFCSRVVAPFLVPFWHDFGVILGLRGDPETSWGAFVPHLCPRILPSSIFSSFWAALGAPFGTLFGDVFGPRPAAEPPGGHFLPV